MADANHPDEVSHQRVVAAVQALHPNKSRLRNGISSHRMGGPVSFPLLDGFAQRASAALVKDAEQRLFIGSVDGDLYVSAQVRVDAGSKEEPGPKRKRQRDDCAERAERAVADIRRRVKADGGSAATLTAVELARDSIEALLRSVKGARREEAVESCGLSLAPALQTGAGAVGAPSGMSERPRLIIACRLSAGVPLPLLTLKRALGTCFQDGMVTTRPESLGPSYQLPLSAAGQAVEQSGQRSLLLFAAVPIVAQPVPVAAVAPAGAAAPAAAATAPNK